MEDKQLILEICFFSWNEGGEFLLFGITEINILRVVFEIMFTIVETELW